MPSKVLLNYMVLITLRLNDLVLTAKNLPW